MHACMHMQLHHAMYCSLQVGCHSQWFILDIVVSTVDIVWFLCITQSLSRETDSIWSLIDILVPYHKQAVFTLVQWLCKIASNTEKPCIAKAHHTISTVLTTLSANCNIVSLSYSY